MTILNAVSIISAENSELVEAQIVVLTPEVARQQIDGQWWQHPNLHDESAEVDRNWNWESSAVMPVYNPLYGCVAVCSMQNYLEGVMAYRLNAESKREAGRGCLFVDRLAVAPRNRKWICSSPFYKGIGSRLLWQAVEISYLNGMEGRIALQAVPNSHTRQFYEAVGFVQTDLGQPAYRLIDYELSAASAAKLRQQFKED